MRLMTLSMAQKEGCFSDYQSQLWWLLIAPLTKVPNMPVWLETEIQASKVWVPSTTLSPSLLTGQGSSKAIVLQVK